MKKFLILLVSLMSLGYVAKSQTCFTGTTTKPATACTATAGGLIATLNTSIDTLNLIMSGDYNEVMTVQVLLTETSGTTAGTVRLYGSNYSTTGTWDAVGDTLTLSDATVNSHTWTISKPAYKYYRILHSGGTTMAGFMSAHAVGLKPR